MLKLAHRTFAGVVYEMPCECYLRFECYHYTACQVTAVSFGVHCSRPGHNGPPYAAVQNMNIELVWVRNSRTRKFRATRQAALCSIRRTTPGLEFREFLCDAHGDTTPSHTTLFV